MKQLIIFLLIGFLFNLSAESLDRVIARRTYPHHRGVSPFYEKKMTAGGVTILETIFDSKGHVLYQASYDTEGRTLSLSNHPNANVSLFIQDQYKLYLQTKQEPSFSYFIHGEQRIIEKIYYPNSKKTHTIYRYYDNKGLEVEAITLDENKKTSQRIVKTYNSRQQLIGESIDDFRYTKPIHYKRNYLYHPKTGKIIQELEYDRWERLHYFYEWQYVYNPDGSLKQKIIRDLLHLGRVKIDYSYQNGQLKSINARIYQNKRLQFREYKTFQEGKLQQVRFYHRYRLKAKYVFQYTETTKEKIKEEELGHE